MNAILLCWNPAKWNDWDPDYNTVAQGVRENRPLLGSWSIGNHVNGIGPGTEAWLLKQGGLDATSRGILGHAIVASTPWRDTDAKDPAKTSNYVDVEFDWLLPESDLIDVPTLESATSRTKWRKIYSSGRHVDPADLSALRTLWVRHAQPTVDDPDDEEVPGTYPEGAKRLLQVNRYERSRVAREECIRHHGSSCKACGFDFRTVYGKIGDGYIQVHHTVPVSQMGGSYTINPVTDLVPLCANCHVMAHRRKPDPYTVREIKVRLKRGGKRVQ